MKTICDDCGKDIGMLDASYYRTDPAGGLGKTYHSDCGDPFGLKGQRAQIIEECAKVAENFPARLLTTWGRPGGPPGNGHVDVNGQVYIAQAIRALIPATPANTESGGK